METVVKDFLLQLILFSFIEGMLLNYYIINIYNIKSIKIKNIFLYSVGITIIYFILPPVLRQVGIILFTYIFVKNVKISFLWILYLLITETVIVFCYNLFLSIDFVYLTKLETFIFMIPIRVVQFLIIFLYSKYNRKE